MEHTYSKRSIIGRTDFRTRVLGERYYLSISQLHQCVAQSLRYLQPEMSWRAQCTAPPHKKKSGGVENCSFRTKRSFFDFCVQNWLWMSYSFRNRDSKPSTLPLAWSKMLTANMNFYGQTQRMLSIVLEINFRTAIIEYKHNALHNKFDILS